MLDELVDDAVDAYLDRAKREFDSAERTPHLSPHDRDDHQGFWKMFPHQGSIRRSSGHKTNTLATRPRVEGDLKLAGSISDLLSGT